HHTGKNLEQGARGSSVLKGAVDTECPVARAGELTVLGPPVQRDLAEDFKQSFEAREVEFGLDHAAEPATSLVLVPTDREVPPEEKLSKPAQQALDVLWNETKVAGVHGGAGGPPIVGELRAIREDRWRELCKERGLTTSTGERAINQAFARARERLISVGK